MLADGVFMWGELNQSSFTVFKIFKYMHKQLHCVLFICLWLYCLSFFLTILPIGLDYSTFNSNIIEAKFASKWYERED